MDLKTEEELLAPPKGLKIFGRILKWTFLIGLLLVIGWLSLRACYQEGTTKVKRYLWTEEAATLYEAGELTVMQIPEINEVSTERAFYLLRPYYTPALGQFQFTLRCNEYNELVREILKEGGIDSFTFVLADDEGNRYTAYEYITDSALMYRFYRIAFSGVDLTTAKELRVYIYPKGGEVAFEDALENCKVWNYENATREYSLTKAEKKAAKKPSKGLMSGETLLLPEEE